MGGGGSSAVADGAFNEIDKRHRPALERYARRLLRSRSDTEDAVQDGLVAAHAALAAGEPVRELRAWLYRLVRNTAIDEIRSARTRAGELADDHADQRDTDPAGSVVVNPRQLHAGERMRTVCATSSYVKHAPGSVMVGTAY